MDRFFAKGQTQPAIEELGLARLSLPKLERITVDWKRLSSGLWRVPEGDISQAYCSDTFPRLKVFTEAGQLFTNCGTSSVGMRREAWCYPLLEPGRWPQGKTPYSYEGLIGKFRGESWVLGAKVTFVGSEPGIEEWQKLFRSLYADGGYFAQQLNYGDFLRDRSQPLSKNEQRAFEKERSSDLVRLSKIEVCSFLDNGRKPQPPSFSTQLDLFG